MASSLLLLLDDIATVLDDVAVMSKMAAKKTAGVLGDDLALNAQQVSGVRSERELPVVWAVARGSLVNKAILVPGALATCPPLAGTALALQGSGGPAPSRQVRRSGGSASRGSAVTGAFVQALAHASTSSANNPTCRASSSIHK